MSIDYKLIGKRIKQKRKQLGKTQEVFAEELSVTVGYVSQFERGITKLSLDRLSEISALLNCDLSFLVSGVTTENIDYSQNEFLNNYSKLSNRDKQVVRDLIDSMIKN